MSAVWLNGALVPASLARIDPADRGFTLGDGIFETLRVEQSKPQQTARHLARLRESAAILGIDIPYTDSVLRDGLHAVIRASGHTEAVLRLTLSRGPAARGVLPAGADRPTILISTAPLPPPAPPANLIISKNVRRNELSPLSRIKSLNYLDSVLARQEAAEAGMDDALLLNTHGFLAEATAANVFLVVEGRLVTPRVADGALPGIRRALLLEHGAAAEIQISPEMIAQAEAAFLVNSLGLRGIAAIDGRALQSWDLRELGRDQKEAVLF